MHEVRRLRGAVAELFEVQAVPPWLGRRNPSFDNMTPPHVIEVGEIARLWQMACRPGGRVVG